MKRHWSPVLHALCATGLALVGATPAEAKPRLTGEQQLAKMLEGKVAGTPVDCITLHTIDSTTVIDKTAVVYKSGRTYYVQRPRAGADQLDDDDILVTRLTTSELCSIDTVQLHDRVTGFWHGFLTLDKFVPYAKPRTK